MLRISPTRHLSQIVIDVRDGTPRISFDIYADSETVGRPIAQCWIKGDLMNPVLSDVLNNVAIYIRQLLEGAIDGTDTTGQTSPASPNNTDGDTRRVSD